MVDDDWRLGGNEFLRGLVVRRKAYDRWSSSWDHDHCELCWATIVPPDAPHRNATTLHEGYAVAAHTVRTPDGSDRRFPDDYRWICPGCFDALHEHFGWTVEDEE